MIITYKQAEQLLEAKKQGLKRIDVSLDLNISKIKIENDNF